MKDAKQAYQDRIYASMDDDPSRQLDHKLYRFILPYAATRAAVIRKMLANEHFKEAVELGSAQGDIALACADFFDRYELLDISPYQFSRVPEKLRTDPRIVFRQYDLDRPLDYPDGRFDIAISTSTIEYLYDPIAFVKEVFRVLRPGGTFILATMNLAFFMRRLQLLSGRLPTFNAAPGWQGGILHHFTYPATEGLLRSSGFRIVRRTCSGLLPPLRMLWPNLLASDMIFRSEKPPAPDRP